jgi:hydrophobic/amphiphilic exporter-1 (mainly G- bacteria), HAE1 family
MKKRTIKFVSGFMLLVLALLNCKTIKHDMPDYYIIISTGFHSGSAESADNTITRSIEEALKNIEMKSIFSYTTEDTSTVIIQFPGNNEPGMMTKVIQDKINKISNQFPKETDKPLITEYSSDEMPIVFAGVDSQNLSRYDLNKICNDDLQKKISEVKGITGIVTGYEKPKIVIVMSMSLLKEYNISLSDAVKSLKKSYNDSKSKTGSGIIYEITASKESRDAVEKFNGIYNSIDELSNFPIGKYSDNEIIRLKDAAQLRFDSDFSCYSRINGKTYPGIMIKMQKDQNMIKLKTRLHEVIANLEKDLPVSVKLIFFN